MGKGTNPELLKEELHLQPKKKAIQVDKEVEKTKKINKKVEKVKKIKKLKDIIQWEKNSDDKF